MGELAASIAHEVRNPLAIISNAVAGLRRVEPAGGDHRVLLDIVEEEAGRLNRLVTDLLRFARPVTLRPTTVDLAELAQVVTQGPGAGALELCAEPVRIEADESLLRVALTNLVENARQASASQGLVTGSLANYGKASFDSAAAVAPATDTITVGNQGWKTGDAVVYRKGDAGSTVIGGLTDGATYYVIATNSPNVIKLASSQANANSGTAVNFTSTGSGANQSLARADYSRSAGSTNDRVGAASNQAANRLSAAGPSQSGITNAINNAPTATGTEAAIASGATVTANQNIQVLAVENAFVTVLTGSAAGGFVGIGASVTIISLNANVSAHADGTLSAGTAANVNATLNEQVNVL